MATRMATYFVPGAGIDREVITTDICRYLGPDALVKPGNFADPKRGPNAQPEAGYFVTAYRSLTTDQLTDIKADSARWIAERSKPQQNNSQQMGGDGYRASATRARQQDQPYIPNVAPVYGQPPLQQQAQIQYEQYGRAITLPQPQGQYQSGYTQTGQYPYTQVTQQGQTVPYGFTPPTGQRPQVPQGSQAYPQPPTAYPQPPTNGYPPQGRGTDIGHGLPDTRPQQDYSSYGGSIGRSQPIAPQQQYPTSSQPLDPYAHQLAPTGQTNDTAMGDYDDYQESYVEPSPAPTPLTQAQPASRQHRSERDRGERERSDRDKEEPRRGDKHRRR